LEYKELKISLQPLLPAKEVLLYELGELGFDSFTEEPNGLNAYIPSKDYNQQAFEALLEHIKPHLEVVEVEINTIPDQNWNEVWESNFQPITIDNKCVVRAPFHNIENSFEHEVIINPQMSFGTGHHETTYLMMDKMLAMNWQNKQVLDMGSGTGILAILAIKLGAKNCDAIDVEEWAYHNAKENVLLNNVANIHVLLGDASLIENKANTYDVVIANINRNVLMQDMQNYAKSMKNGAQLLLSGFYITDAETLITHAQKLGLCLIDKKEKNTWCLLHLSK
jgi:ribosomal protein L11 methyltransferase